MRTRWPVPLLIVAGWSSWLLLYAVLAQSSSAIHHDMAEAYAWGIEWPWGTYKHPPLVPWLVGAWFSIVPRTDTGFFALSALNAGVAVLGAWLFTATLANDSTDRAPAGAGSVAASDGMVPLLVLTPSFGLLALTFNANSVLLALWPWTAYAFLRSLKRQDWTSGALFGLLGGLALLGKYFSILLLFSCFIAALLHPDRDRYFRSRAPYVAVLVALLVTAPHGVWSWIHDFPTLSYAMEKADQPLGPALAQALGTLFGSVALAAIPAGALALARRSLVVPGPLPSWQWVLFLGPWVATILLGLIGRLGISTNFLIPALFVMPALLLCTTPVLNTVEVSRLNRLALATMLALIALAPVLAIVQFRNRVDAAAEPRRELALAVTALWRENVGTPLKLTAGSAAYGLSLPFYSPDRPSDFTDLDPAKAPWVSQARIDREGLLVVCLAGDRGCRDLVAGRTTDRTVTRRLTIARQWWGMTGPEFTFDVTLFPPATAFAARQGVAAPR
jgi:Dolichyl-phosphate-mannose-protein mannosyltransferase